MHTKLMVAVLFSTAASLNASPIADAVAGAGSDYGNLARACVKSATASLLVVGAFLENVVAPVLTGVAKNVGGFVHSLSVRDASMVVAGMAFIMIVNEIGKDMNRILPSARRWL